MIFEPGKFYLHEAGRAIAVQGKVDTFKWGTMLIIEEVDHTGHGISCVEITGANDHGERWVEIGKEGFMKVFRGNHVVH